METSKTDPRVVTKKVGDARSVVIESSKIVPVYKRLHAETRSRDEKLNRLEFEVRLAEEELVGLRKVVQVVEVEDEQEVMLSDIYFSFSFMVF